jgi:exodeoxyribonuclease VII small subunit
MEVRMAEKKELKLEDILEQLDETVSKLETEQLNLEESFQCFSKGMELVKQGNKSIDQVEKKMQILLEKE